MHTVVVLKAEGKYYIKPQVLFGYKYLFSIGLTFIKPFPSWHSHIQSASDQKIISTSRANPCLSCYLSMLTNSWLDFESRPRAWAWRVLTLLWQTRAGRLRNVRYPLLCGDSGANRAVFLSAAGDWCRGPGAGAGPASWSPRGAWPGSARPPRRWGRARPRASRWWPARGRGRTPGRGRGSCTGQVRSAQAVDWALL